MPPTHAQSQESFVGIKQIRSVFFFFEFGGNHDDVSLWFGRLSINISVL